MLKLRGVGQGRVRVGEGHVQEERHGGVGMALDDSTGALGVALVQGLGVERLLHDAMVALPGRAVCYTVVEGNAEVHLETSNGSPSDEQWFT